MGVARLAQRALLGAMALGLVIVASGTSSAGSSLGPWDETRFRTGCDPGPIDPPPWPEVIPPHQPVRGVPELATLEVDLDPARAHRPLVGSGFNIEHALWSCPAFRPLLNSELLGPFAPAVMRVDTGLLPAAPAHLSAAELGPEVYRSVLRSAQYADSWPLFRRLNAANVKVILGVWGGPAQFTLEGVRRGTLDPQHYDAYVDYVATVVEFMVREEHIQVWATTIANEPDGGDGCTIPPDGLAYIGRQLARRLAPLGVKLYGPDTASGDNAMPYLRAMFADPVLVDSLAFVGFHQYYATPEVQRVVEFVRTSPRPDLPVIVTEYTSFLYGALDDGQDTTDRVGFTLDILAMLLAHYRYGADAALYWDLVDYLQPGHDVITRWGLLRGPQRDFARRLRYYGMLQVLPYLRPGAQVLSTEQGGGSQLGSLAVRTTSGEPAVILVNQDVDDVNLNVRFSGPGSETLSQLTVWRTDRDHRAEPQGRLRVQRGSADIVLPGRSLTTLFPSGRSPERLDSSD
jgi:O-glycosyl hydrolase